MTDPGGEIDVGEEALDLLTVKEVAVRLRLSKATVGRLIRSGELESVTIGRARRVAPEAVAAFKRARIEAGRKSAAA